MIKRYKGIEEIDYGYVDVPAPYKSILTEYDGRGRMRLSVSRMQVFVKCPYAFKMSYLEKLDADEKESKERMDLGKDLHDVFYRAAYQPKPEILRSDDGYNEFQEHYENFIKYQNSLKKEFGDCTPLFAEKEIYDEEDNVVLYIDRINDLQDGTVEVLDYKTGSTHPISKHRFQLSLYAYYIEKHLHLRVSKWTIFYTREADFKKAIKTEKASREKINMIPEIVRLIRDDIDYAFVSNGFYKRCSFLCGWCGLRGYGMCDPKNLKMNSKPFGILDIYNQPWSNKEKETEDFINKPRYICGGIAVVGS